MDKPTAEDIRKAINLLDSVKPSYPQYVHYEGKTYKINKDGNCEEIER